MSDTRPTDYTPPQIAGRTGARLTLARIELLAAIEGFEALGRSELAQRARTLREAIHKLEEEFTGREVLP